MDVQALANRLVILDISKPGRVLACVQGGPKKVTIGDDDVMWLQSRIYVPNMDGLRELILEEAHSLRYSIHLGAAKMYCDLKQHYLWRRMRKEIVGYVAWSGLLGTDLVRDASENEKLIKQRLRTAESQQKSYTNRMVRDVAFMEGEKVLLRLSPMKGVMRFGKKEKLSPWYIGPFKKYDEDPSHVLDFSSVKLKMDLAYDEESVAIMDR
ncbi:uncharacterized protein [Nicotiana tomentosiformis]|uniref:uncharacterized protein n=1 Tax=Nicotiana tomentosiformis TaxID=4098 RepID=UPI00388CD376